MQLSPNLDQTLPPNSLVHLNSKAVQFSDETKPLPNVPFKIQIKPTKVTSELLSQNGKTFHTQRNDLIPIYPKKLMLFPQIQSYNEQKSEIYEDSVTSDMIQNDHLYFL